MISKAEMKQAVELVKEHADELRQHGVHQLVFGGKLSITFGPEFGPLVVNMGDDERQKKRPPTSPTGGWANPAGYQHGRTPRRRTRKKEE